MVVYELGRSAGAAYTYYEYKQETGTLYGVAELANRLAKDGWRLVSVVPGSYNAVHLYFERPVVETPS